MTYNSLYDPGLLFPSMELLELFADAIICLLNLFFGLVNDCEKERERKEEKRREGKKVKKKGRKRDWASRKFKCSNDLKVTKWFIWWFVC